MPFNALSTQNSFWIAPCLTFVFFFLVQQNVCMPHRRPLVCICGWSWFDGFWTGVTTPCKFSILNFGKYLSNAKTLLPFQTFNPRYILDLILPSNWDREHKIDGSTFQICLSAWCRVAPFRERVFGKLNKDCVNRRPTGLRWNDRFLPTNWG